MLMSFMNKVSNKNYNSKTLHFEYLPLPKLSSAVTAALSWFSSLNLEGKDYISVMCQAPPKYFSHFSTYPHLTKWHKLAYPSPSPPDIIHGQPQVI